MNNKKANKKRMNPDGTYKYYLGNQYRAEQKKDKILGNTIKMIQHGFLVPTPPRKFLK